MDIVEFGPEDGELVSGAFEVLRAAHEFDIPEGPPPHWGVFEKSLAHPMPDEDSTSYVALRDGKVVGTFRTMFPNRENKHFGMASLTVHPEHRRQGIGTSMLERFLQLARAESRTEVSLDTHVTWEDGPARSEAGAEFLKKHGFTLALTSVNRRCLTDAMAPEDEQTLMDKSVAAAGDEYEIISWTGRTPPELVDTMCRIDSMILSEVPLGELNLEPEVVDPELKEAKAVRNEALGVLPLQTVARHRASGEVVANTILGVFDDTEYTDGFQWITIVDPAHRGHRLGTLIKLVNLRLLREQHPHVRRIWTDNADVNAHMIDINVKMGFESVDALAEMQRKI
ncbi:GNAT family N-acetyltransferase [Glycomyces buryatensis]|nr:GNAT family N-acetyltransferase [Glycomyces buryatensis]